MMKKTIISTLATFLLATGALMAQTAFTTPTGFVTVNITPAPSASTSSSTAFSISLRGMLDFSGQATAVSGQTITVAGQSWNPTAEWAQDSSPHLLYISNDDGEEAFLITANTADTLTVDASINLQSRFTQDAQISIVNATTIGGLFGATSAEVDFLESASVTQADNIFLWSGTSWDTYYYDGVAWRRLSNPFVSANNEVVFPDDGIFVLRRGTDPLSLMFTGAVPIENQLTQIPQGSTFIGSRYPVDTQIQNMGFLDLAGWVSNASVTQADNVYVWLGSSWETYYHNGSSWRTLSNPFSNADTDVIAGNSAMFILKRSAGSGAVASPVPYNINN